MDIFRPLVVNCQNYIPVFISIFYYCVVHMWIHDKSYGLFVMFLYFNFIQLNFGEGARTQMLSDLQQLISFKTTYSQYFVVKIPLLHIY